MIGEVTGSKFISSLKYLRTNNEVLEAFDSSQGVDAKLACERSKEKVVASAPF